MQTAVNEGRAADQSRSTTPRGEGKATVANWDTSKVDVAKEGTYEATATTDVYGNEFNVAIRSTLALAVSIRYRLVLAGTSASEAKAALEAAPVYLHVKASPAFEGDAAMLRGTSMGLIPSSPCQGWRQHCRDRYVPAGRRDHDCAEGHDLCHRRHA